MALVHWSHAFNNPLSADYTEGMSGPNGLRASSPGRPPYSGTDVVGLLKKAHSRARANTQAPTDARAVGLQIQ